MKNMKDKLETKIKELAKKEIEKSNNIGFIKLPETEKIVKKYVKNRVVKVIGLCNWSKRYKKTYNYLIIKINPDRWDEVYFKYKL